MLDGLPSSELLHLFDSLHSFDPLHALGLGVVLLVTLAVGVCVHELLHVVPLSLADATYTVTVLPDDGPASGTGLAALGHVFTGGLVGVEIERVSPTTPVWVVRAAALLPLVLALPLALVLAGVLPDPLAAGDHLATVALVGLTACGLPSPGDWAVAWHAPRLYRGQE